MRYPYGFRIIVVILSSMLGLMAGCQNEKKSEDRPGVAGNAYTDGYNVYTGGYLNGQYINVQINTFSMVYLDPNIYGNSGGGFAYSPYLNFNGLQFNLTVNNQQATIQAPFAIQAVTAGTAATVGQMAAVTVGSFDVRYQARCVNNECDPYYLNVIISQANSTKQIGIKRSRSQDSTIAVLEADAMFTSVRSTDQIVTDLNVLK